MLAWDSARVCLNLNGAGPEFSNILSGFGKCQGLPMLDWDCARVRQQWDRLYRCWTGIVPTFSNIGLRLSHSLPILDRDCARFSQYLEPLVPDFIGCLAG